jgi:predicted nuclease of restriction endonuclease-like (RecB) superfamily
MARKREDTPKPARPRKTTDLLPKGYDQLLGQLKERIRSAQLRAGLAVNREMVLLYWHIGREILQRQEHEGWGAKVIDRLAADLRHAFPDMTGLSPRNLKYMRAFGAAWPDEPIVQQLVAQIPWGHCVRLLDYVKDRDEREFYIRKTIENGWSRTVLVHWIESDLYQRQGKATTNFGKSLPSPQSDLAREILKDPYKFEFLSMAEEAEERALQKALLAHIQQFLVELGAGFAFVGQQYHLEVGGEDFYIDLLFYHLKLRCYVVIDLKMTPFRRRRPAPPSRRQALDRDHPLQGEEPGRGRIRAARPGQAGRRVHLHHEAGRVVAFGPARQPAEPAGTGSRAEERHPRRRLKPASSPAASGERLDRHTASRQARRSPSSRPTLTPSPYPGWRPPPRLGRPPRDRRGNSCGSA